MSTTLEPLELDRDLALLHAWVTHPRSVYWQMQGASVLDVAEEYRRIRDTDGHDAHLGRVDGVPTFLAETYDPHRSELAGLPDLADGDLGMHVLVAPPADGSAPVHGLTSRVMAAVVGFCFADPAVRRVVVEPDVRNDRIAALNAAAGFRVLREVDLGHKTAALGVCTRDDFAGSRLGATTTVHGGAA